VRRSEWEKSPGHMPSIPQGAKNKIGFCLSGQGTVDKVERRVILDSLPAMHPYQFSKAAIPHLLSTLRSSDLPPARHIRADPLEPFNYYDQEATVEQELPVCRYAVLSFAVHQHCVCTSSSFKKVGHCWYCFYLARMHVQPAPRAHIV
jgi:hypothetical protein